jgi:acetolactate synthase small subunit
MLKALTFVVSAENHPGLLARTVLLLHRLAIPIHALSMHRPRKSARMRITIEVLADPEQSDRIAANFAKLAHIVSVTNKRNTKPVPHTPNGRKR